MLKGKSNTTKLITVSAMLVAMCLAWITLIPTVPIPPWSFTAFSHIFIFIALFINPFVAGSVAIGTFFAFMLKGTPIDVQFRALSHIIFVIYGMFFIEYIGVNTKSKLITYILSTAVLHGIIEALVVILLIKMSYIESRGLIAIWGAACGATIVHSIIDSVAAFFVFRAINSRLKLKPKGFLYRS